VCNLATGASCTVSVAGGWAGNFKLGSLGLSLAEFTINGWDSLDYYDISYIVGFDFGLQIKAPNGGTTLTCPAKVCTQAYEAPNDLQTNTCTTGGQFVVTWCP